MTADTTTKAAEKARQLVERKLAQIDALQTSANELEVSKQNFRDHYDAAVNAGWSKNELKDIGFEALPAPKKKATKGRPRATGTPDTASGQAEESSHEGSHPGHQEGEPADQHHHEHDQFAHA